MSFAAPALISSQHVVERFDCGNDALNHYLVRFALTNTATGSARTYVTTARGEMYVIGYYSLAAGSVERANVPERVAQGVSNHPVPIVVLARLAVDLKYQGQGVGKGLLRDALTRILAAADIIGVRAILVHAKNPKAAEFYTGLGFTPAPINPLMLWLLIKDLRRSL